MRWQVGQLAGVAPVGQALVASPLAPPGALTATAVAGTSALALSTAYTWGVTAVARDGTETTPATASVTTGPASAVMQLTWPVVEQAAAYYIYRGASATTLGRIGQAYGTHWVDTGVTASGVAPPVYNQTGQVVAGGPLTVPVGVDAYATEVPQEGG